MWHVRQVFTTSEFSFLQLYQHCIVTVTVNSFFFNFKIYLLTFTVPVLLPYGNEWIFLISLFIVRYDHFLSVLPVTVDKAYCQYCRSSWILYYFIFKNFDFIFLINVLKILYFYSYIFNFIFWFYIFGYIFLILYFWFYIFDFVFSVLYY